MPRFILCALALVASAASASASPLRAVEELYAKLDAAPIQSDKVLYLKDVILDVRPFLDFVSPAAEHARRLQGAGSRTEMALNNCRRQFDAWVESCPPDEIVDEDPFEGTMPPSQSLASFCATAIENFGFVCQFSMSDCPDEWRAWTECSYEAMCGEFGGDWDCGNIETDDHNCGAFQVWCPGKEECTFENEFFCPDGFDESSSSSNPDPSSSSGSSGGVTCPGQTEYCNCGGDCKEGEEGSAWCQCAEAQECCGNPVDASSSSGSEPAPVPRPVPVPAPAPGDSTSWHKNGDPSKDCGFVAKDTAKRCTLKGDGAEWAFEACAASCGAAGAKCEDLDEWYKEGDNTKDCTWVSRFINRCAVDGWNGKKGYESCKHACKTCDASIPFCTMPCADDEDWSKKGDASKDCAFVAQDPAKRCTLKGDGAIWAFEACKRTCGACDASCSDDPDWHKAGETSKDCAWAKRFVNRCAVDGDDGRKGYEACPLACGTCCV